MHRDCTCALAEFPSSQAWHHAQDCGVYREWKQYETARELEDDELRAERKQTERELHG